VLKLKSPVLKLIASSLVAFVLFETAPSIAATVRFKIDKIEMVKFVDIPGSELGFAKPQIIPSNLEVLLRIGFSVIPALNNKNFRDFHIVMRAYTCDQKRDFFKVSEDLVFGDIISGGSSILPLSKQEQTVNGYHVYLMLQSGQNSNLSERSQYNFKVNPQDICVELSGGKMWFGGKLLSNVERISKAELSRAIIKNGE
jgi:hypothetical protein